MKKTLLVTAGILFAIWNIQAQQPLNLDFERKSVEVGRPWGWAVEGWRSSTTFEQDSITVKSGRYSLRSECKTGCETAIFSFEMEPLELKGKTITITGKIKGEGVQQPTGIALYLTTAWDEKKDNYPEQEIRSTSHKGSFDWKKVSLSFKVPEETERLAFRVINGGAGQVWFDDFQLTIDGKTVTELAAAPALSKTLIQSLTQQATAFQTPLPQQEDWTFFKKAIDKSTIVALGESTHGTGTFFSLKHKALQYAVEEMGFRIFAIEDHQLIVQKADRYIKTGQGDVRTAMQGMFDIWKKQEVIALLQWMREYNRTHPNDPVTIIGIDMQLVGPAVDSLLGFLKAQDMALFDRYANVLLELKENGNRAYMEQDSTVKMEWLGTAAKLLHTLTVHEKQWLATVKGKGETQRIRWGVQYGRLIYQYFQEVLHNGAELYRDQAMAENLSWYLDFIQPGAKVVLWAHDVHVSRGDHPVQRYNMHSGKSMGSFLSKRYGEQYKSFGLSTYRGTYRAFTNYRYQKIIDAPLFQSPEGSLEEALHQIAEIKKQENLFLPLTRNHKALNAPLPVRFANHVSFDYGYWTRYSIPYQFDGLFFIDHTHAAKDLK